MFYGAKKAYKKENNFFFRPIWGENAQQRKKRETSTH